MVEFRVTYMLYGAVLSTRRFYRVEHQVEQKMSTRMIYIYSMLHLCCITCDILQYYYNRSRVCLVGSYNEPDFQMS